MSVFSSQEINYVHSSSANIDPVCTLQPISQSEKGADGPSRAGQRRLRTETVSGTVFETAPNELLDAYIKYGHNTNGIPALHAAIKARDEKIVRLFLDHGADPNAYTVPHVDFGVYPPPHTALEFAAAFANSDMVNLLIDRGANVNPDHVETVSPIRCAAGFNNPEVIRTLVRRGADLSKEQKVSHGALMVAALQGNAEAITTLIELGMSPNSPNVMGQTPLDFAARAYIQSHREAPLQAIEALLMKGADSNIKSHGMTVLHMLVAFSIHASEPRLLKITQLLLQHGADSNACDEQGKTVLGRLTQLRLTSTGYNFPAVEKLLKDHGAKI